MGCDSNYQNITLELNLIKPTIEEYLSAVKEREDIIVECDTIKEEKINEIKELQKIFEDNFGNYKFNNSLIPVINNTVISSHKKQKRTIIPNIDNIIISIISENENLTIKELNSFLELKCNETLREQTTRKRVEGLLARNKIIDDGNKRNTRYSVKKQENNLDDLLG
jgi:ribosomal protein L28